MSRSHFFSNMAGLRIFVFTDLYCWKIVSMQHFSSKIASPGKSGRKIKLFVEESLDGPSLPTTLLGFCLSTLSRPSKKPPILERVENAKIWKIWISRPKMPGWETERKQTWPKICTNSAAGPPWAFLGPPWALLGDPWIPNT